MKNWIFSIAALAAFIAPVDVLADYDFSASPDRVVTELPAGAKASDYLREGFLFRKWGSDAIRQDPLQAALVSIAQGTDGKVYLANPLSNPIYGETEGYLVGNLQGDKVTFTFPQVIKKGDSYVTVMRLVESTMEVPDYEGITFTRPTYKVFEGEQQVSFTLTDGKFVQTPEECFGFVDTEGNWTGYGEYDLSFSPFDETLVTGPEDAEAFDVAFKYESSLDLGGEPGIYRLLHGRKKGNELYIQGLSTFYPESWIKGEISGDRIVFASGQFIGIGNYEIQYFCTGVDTPVFIPGYNVWEHNFTLTDSMEMAFHEATREISALDKNDCFILNSSKSIYSYGDTYINPSMAPQPESVDPTPIMPLFKKGVNQWENGMEPFLSFQVRPLNIYGHLLEQKNIGFEIEVEGKPYVFDADTYWMYEDMTIIPWCFNDAFIEMLPNGFSRVSFQEPFLRDVAIRTVYKVGDELYYSDRQWPSNPVEQDPVSGVKALDSTESPVIETRFFDLHGNIVADPSDGVFIRQTVLEDGSVRRSKVVF